MNVLIGCEESGVSCSAFRKRGHYAFSCDLLPTRGEHTWHYQEDIISLLKRSLWDLVILHPDCTKIAVCGNRFWAGTSDRKFAINWTVDLWELAKTRARMVALENPASVIWPYLRRAGADVQFIQPWQFGHLEQKKTGLALHGLPRLQPTRNVYDEMMLLSKCKRERVFFQGPSKTRKRDRSETYSGFAEAFAEQWGG